MGWSVGDRVGDASGRLWVGTIVGTRVGVSVGVLVGDGVGTRVGSANGGLVASSATVGLLVVVGGAGVVGTEPIVGAVVGIAKLIVSRKSFNPKSPKNFVKSSLSWCLLPTFPSLGRPRTVSTRSHARSTIEVSRDFMVVGRKSRRYDTHSYNAHFDLREQSTSGVMACK